MSEVFGPIVHGGHVQDAALATLEKWLPTYLAELAERAGKRRGSLSRIRSWTRAADLDTRFPEDALPAVSVASASLGDPERRGDGRLDGTFDLAIGVVCSAGSRGDVEDLARLYVTAVRACLLHKRLPDLEGFQGVDFVDEDVDEVDDPRKRRNLAGGIVTFDVHVAGVLNVYAGPTEPDPRPAPHVYDDDPLTVATATVDVTIANPE